MAAAIFGLTPAVIPWVENELMAIEATSAAVAALATVVAVFVAWVQLRSLAQDSKVTRKATVSTAYSAISEGSGRISSHLLEKPRVYERFWDEPARPLEERRAALIAEMYLDFVDSVIEQQRDITDDMDWSTWDSYFRTLYRESPVLRSYIGQNFDYYPDYTYYHLGLIVIRTGSRGDILSCWRAHECPSRMAGRPLVHEDDPGYRALNLLRGTWNDMILPEDGFPWCRTWLFEKVDAHGEPAVERRMLAASVTRVTTFETHRPWRRRNPLKVREYTAALVECREDGHPCDEELDALRGWVAHTMRSPGFEHVQFEFKDGSGHPTIALNPREHTISLFAPNYAVDTFRRVPLRHSW